MDIQNINNFLDLREKNDYTKITTITKGKKYRHIYGKKSNRRGEGPNNKNPNRYSHCSDKKKCFKFDRKKEEIKRIFLHQLDVSGKISDERTKTMIANFFIQPNGKIIYTVDVEYILNDAGGKDGIDIEFVGSFYPSRKSKNERLTKEAIIAGRQLLRELQRQIGSITHIHPHGQLKLKHPKKNSCPGPDIWVNVGEWAVSKLGLKTKYKSIEISTKQKNMDYLQEIPKISKPANGKKESSKNMKNLFSNHYQPTNNERGLRID